MTYEEAIKILHKDRALCMFNPMTGVNEPMNEDCRLSAFALDAAIKALEKQIPKKPDMTVEENYLEEYTFYHCDCPTCGEFIGGGRTRYPHHCICGQALDWSDAK